MKDYLKMADVFDCEVESDADLMFSDSLGNIADFSGYKSQCRYSAHAINSHDELVAMSKELLAEIKMMAKAYVNLLELGKDRIESLGGDCYGVAYMAANDASLVHACRVIGKYEGARV